MKVQDQHQISPNTQSCQTSVIASTVYLQDCVEGMKLFEDNYFDLAIVDPPYGIGNALVDGGGTRKAKFDNNRDSVKWDIVPTKEYWNELFRVSKNQIIWGSNYFDLPPTRSNLIWDKMQEFTGSDFELAWTSFDKASKAFRMSRVEAYSQGKIHPTQKPIKLYNFCFNYAEIKEGMKVLDTHLGSGSSRISADKFNVNFTAFEADEVHYKNQEKRFKDYKSQFCLF